MAGLWSGAVERSTTRLRPIFPQVPLSCFRESLHTFGMRNPIIVALDVPNAERAVALVERVSPFAGAFKIGSELFTSAGPEIVRQIRRLGVSVFLDLKFH